MKRLLMGSIVLPAPWRSVMNKRRPVHRFTIILMLLAVLSCGLHARTETKWFDIQGVYGETLSLSVDPIASQTLYYIAGMPFDILDDQVVASQLSSGGRQIAYFSIGANIPFVIEIQAGHMYHVDNRATKTKPLEYNLTFKFNVSTPQGEGKEQSFSLVSEEGTRREFVIAEDVESVDSGFLGVLDGGIYFCFTQEGEANANDDNYAPDGEYVAEVVITVKGR